MHPLELERHVRKLVEPVLDRRGIDLVSVEWSGGVLRLAIETEAGASVKDCVDASHLVSPVLDADDPIASSYKLEVCSPGIDRPVQRLEDFQRFVGFRSKVRLVEGYPRRRYTGVLRGADAVEVSIEVDGVVHRLPFDAIERANLVLDLDEYQRLAEEGLPPVPGEQGVDRHDDQ